MLKFIRGKGQQPTAERQKLQKELFSYRKTTQHGFPHKPSALAYDPRYKLMAIATTTGGIKVFGKPGVEFYGQHTATNGSTADCAVQMLEWIPGSGRVLSLTTTNQLVLWEPSGSTLIPIKHLAFDGKLKKVSAICCSYSKDIVWIGTEGGNIYPLDLKTFELKEEVIYHDVVLEQVPKTYKLNPGAVESIKQIPTAWNQLLIAYNRGLTVLWDLETCSVLRSYIAPGHGQSVGLHVSANGKQFSWYHADGSYATWKVGDSNPPADLNFVPYGPDPCKSINRLYNGKRGNVDVVVFSGGMPRSAYGDHNCVSVHGSDGSKICLDFTSKVVDFFVTCSEDSVDQLQVLIVLLEEELCAYDLTDPKLPIVKAPYLHSVHASAVLCNNLVSQVSQEVYDKIVQAGEEQDSQCSDIEWPVHGGYLSDEYNIDEDEPRQYEILLTGHEDGSVKFWDITGVNMKPIYHFRTAHIFGPNPGRNSADDGHTITWTFFNYSNEQHHNNQDSEPLDDSEPPFRKSGIFDPYSDDPRLAIKKVTLCPISGKLVVAGTAGQVVIAEFNGRPAEIGPISVTTMNLVSDRDGFVWKGGEKLPITPKLLEENAVQVGDPGVHITGILQILPPANVTCLALQSNWNLVAAGTAHGLVLFDYKNHHPVFHRCTLNPNDLTGAGEQLSRRKSFKKTLRESFRRMRRGRSGRNQNANQANAAMENRPIERQIEARPTDDGMGSVVRCLIFAKTYITNVHNTVPTLWSATNSSTVSVFLIHIPPQSDQSPDSDQPVRNITAQLAKEIQMKHRAPVVGITIFDNTGAPLDHGLSSNLPPPPHKVLIASEEQFKIFSLPQLKPITKYKLTAHEGARVRRLNFSTFSCRVSPDMLHAGGSPSKHFDPHSAPPASSANVSGSSGDHNTSMKLYQEIAVLCLTNLGDILVLSIPELKRQLNAAAVRREDINGITSLCFTNYGEAVYMMSSSELQRISLSASKVVAPEGAIDLEPLDESDINNIYEQNTLEATSTDSLNKEQISSNRSPHQASASNIATSSLNGLTNGHDVSPSNNRANDTITSSIGDITVDSVRDHLNSTVTTLCSTTTEETVGRLTVLSTQTNQAITTVNMKDITDFSIANLKDLPTSNTTETNSSSVVIKSVLTNIIHEKTNGETTTESTVTTTCKESQL